MKILFVFSLIISPIFSANAQKPSASILMDCQKTNTVAKVVFFRPFKPMGSALGFELYLKDSLQTKMRSNSFFVMELPAGKHRIASVTGTDILQKKKHTMDLPVQAGKIYFVKCFTKPYSEGITKPNYRLLFTVLKKEEIKETLQKKKFLRKRVRKKLYNDFFDQLT